MLESPAESGEVNNGRAVPQHVQSFAHGEVKVCMVLSESDSIHKLLIIYDLGIVLLAKFMG